MRAWLPAHSQFGLRLGLPLPRREPALFEQLVSAGDMKHLEKAGETAEVALAGGRRRPAALIIFGGPPAARLRVPKASARTDSPNGPNGRVSSTKAERKRLSIQR